MRHTALYSSVSQVTRAYDNCLGQPGRAHSTLTISYLASRSHGTRNSRTYYILRVQSFVKQDASAKLQNPQSIHRLWGCGRICSDKRLLEIYNQLSPRGAKLPRENRTARPDSFWVVNFWFNYSPFLLPFLVSSIPPSWILYLIKTGSGCLLIAELNWFEIFCQTNRQTRRTWTESIPL